MEGTVMTSKQLFKRATRVIPGGVNSPVRAFNAVGGNPIFVERGKGSKIWTADGTTLTDFCGSWGPLILGHARDEVIDVIKQAAVHGTTFGINTRREVEFAELLCHMIPYVEMVRLVSSGTEAVMTALRLARGFTGRRKIIKFDGCYHGHADYLLVAAGSGLLTGGITSSAGVSPSAVAEVLVAPYNDLEAVEEILTSREGREVAALIVEPVAGNMGLVPPAPGFLKGLRKLTKSAGALLIFDEVITGFRLGPTTYGSLCGVTPDLTCLGKIVGGGMPMGAIGGPSEIMRYLAPLGPVYQAGTLSGNPVAVAAGMKTLQLLKKENPYPALAARGKRLADGINAAACKHDAIMHCAHLGGMFTPFFTREPVTDLTSAKCSNTKAHAEFFHGMLDNGFYLPPAQFEAAFISGAHSDKDIERFVAAAVKVFSAMA